MKLTLVRLVVPSNILSIVVTAPVVGSVTLVRLVAPINIPSISVTADVFQALRSWLNALLFKKASYILVNWDTSQVATRSVALFQLLARPVRTLSVIYVPKVSLLVLYEVPPTTQSAVANLTVLYL